MNDRIRKDLEAIAGNPIKRELVTMMLHALLLWERFKNWIKGGGAI